MIRLTQTDPPHGRRIGRYFQDIRADFFANLRDPCNKLQVIHVDDETALDQAHAATAHVDAILLDSGRPSAKVEQLGGTGRTHD